jgi:hypothetical protein
MDEQVVRASRSNTGRFRPFGLLLDFATPFECCVAHISNEGRNVFFSPMVDRRYTRLDFFFFTKFLLHSVV